VTADGVGAWSTTALAVMERVGRIARGAGAVEGENISSSKIGRAHV
jgi:hypothetical protein